MGRAGEEEVIVSGQEGGVQNGENERRSWHRDRLWSGLGEPRSNRGGTEVALEVGGERRSGVE